MCSGLRLLETRTRTRPHGLLKGSTSISRDIIKVRKTRPFGIIVRVVALGGPSGVTILATIGLSERSSWLLSIIVLGIGMPTVVVRIPLLIIVI